MTDDEKKIYTYLAIGIIVFILVMPWMACLVSDYWDFVYCQFNPEKYMCR